MYPTQYNNSKRRLLKKKALNSERKQLPESKENLPNGRKSLSAIHHIKD
jgi:hypothetical protein